jgi:ribosomal-protein-alanine N-acetyltransferase
MLIRPMVVDDLTAVAHIEAQFPSAWVKGQILDEIERKTGVSLIAENAEEIVGWCCGMLLPPDAELLKIAVAVDSQRQGVANLLLQEFSLLLAENGVTQIFLEARSGNSPALALYRSAGWKKQGNRKNYYTNPTDDAILLLRDLKN